MNQLQSFVQPRLGALLLLFVGGGFLLLLAELLLTGHTQGLQIVAVGTTLIGLVLALSGLLVRGRGRGVVALLFFLLSISGLIGVFEHLEEGEGGAKMALVQTVKAAEEEEESTEPLTANSTEGAEAQTEGTATPPPLAPLSLSGLALLGTVTLLGAAKPAPRNA